MKRRKYLYRDEMIEIEKHLRDHRVYFIAGHDSIYVPKEKTSYIDFTLSQEWPDLEGEVIRMTASEAARTELQRVYPYWTSRVRKAEFPLLDISPPMFYDGKVRYGEFWYADLSGAYYQVYRRLFLDQCWPRGFGELPLLEVADRLSGWKRARNSLIGLTRSHRLIAAEGWKDREVKYHNKYFQPHLWRAVQETLHTLAAQAIARGCCYSNVDSYIFPKQKYWLAFKGILDSLGFEYHYHQGEGYITAFGQYKVGPNKETKAKGREAAPLHKVNRLDRRTIEWMSKIYS